MEEEEGTSHSWPELLGRYFLHGIAFSLLLIILVLVWVFIAALLVVAGFIIGLIIGITLLFLMLGGLNVLLTESIWGTTIKANLMSLLGHGILLLIALVLAGLPYFWFEQVYPSLTTTIVSIVIYAFIDGFIAKNIADIWEGETDDETESEWRTPQAR